MNRFFKFSTGVIALCFLCLTNVAAQNNDPVIDKVIEMGKTDNQTTDHLDILSNRFGGRLVGSDAYNNAADWIEYMFKKWGLEVWRQEVDQMPVGFNRGPWFGRMLGGSGQTLHFATPSYTAGTKGVQRGHVVKEPRTQAELERMKGQLKGAWVLIGGTNSGWPIDYSAKADSIRAEKIAKNAEIEKENREIMMYNRNLMANPPKAVKGKPAPQPKELKELEYEPALFYKEMVEAGILGIIQSSTIPIRALYDRKNCMDMTWETLPTIPDIKLNEDQYNEIAKMVDRREYFQLEFDIRNHFKMGPVKFHNIIGVMKGTEYPDEYVLAGGHLDAFDVATGGVDCGVGVTPTMEAARMLALSGAKPKRTLLFCIWAAEEFGLWGSKHFVQSKTVNLNNVANYFNRDGGPLVPLGITVPEAMYEDYVKVCAPLAGINPDFPFEVKKREGEPGPVPVTAGGSDHAHFVMNGCPAIGMTLGDPKGYNFNYGEIWHTERDLFNKSIPEYQEHTSVVTAIMMYGLGNLDHLPNRQGLYKEYVTGKEDLRIDK